MIFNTKIPTDFKGSYLTNQYAMKVGRKARTIMDFYNDTTYLRKQLAVIIEKETNRSFSDCLDFVANIPGTEFDSFITKSKKFYR